MPRTKIIKRVQIANEKLCKETLKKRLDKFFKRSYELSKLCDLSIYIVIHDKTKSGISTLRRSEDDFYEEINKFMNLSDHDKN